MTIASSFLQKTV